MIFFFICILIFSSCFSIENDNPEKLSSIQKALNIFEKASDDATIIEQLTVIDNFLKTNEHTPIADINVINRQTKQCLLHCALNHGMIGLFEMACKRKCANMHAHENGSGIKVSTFFHWLTETQSTRLIRLALDAEANPDITDGLGQSAFDISERKPHVVNLLKKHASHNENSSTDSQKHRRSQSYAG